MSSPIPTRYLLNTSAALGLFIAANNTYAAFNPRGALNLLGFPVPISPSDQKLVDGITRMFATTRIVLGLTMVAMWWEGNKKALGMSMVAGCLMGISDGFVSRNVVGKGEWGHWGAIPVGLGVGAGLLLAED